MANYFKDSMFSTDEKIVYNKINKFCLEKLNLYKDYSREWIVGYQTFGIFLVGLCNWIHETLSSRKINKVFFLSRDGYIIKKAYELLYPNEKTNYFYVSRRSLSLIAVKNVDDVINGIVLPPMFDIKVLSDALNLDYNLMKKNAVKLNITESEQFKRSLLHEDQRIKKLIEELFEDIMKESCKQTKYFDNYIKQENFFGNIAIVDIGWHNSIQDRLIKILNELNYTTSITGLYVGVYDDAKNISGGNEALGYLYSYGDNINLQYKTFSFASLFETMFLSHEGTTKAYKENGNKIVPNLAEYEYSDEQESLEIVNGFQEGALQFINDFRENKLTDINLNSNICSRNVLLLGCNTLKEDAKLFGGISFENYNKNNIVNFNRSSIYYFTHPKKMIHDFYKSGWRILFLKNLFKIPLPYNFIFKIICTVFNRG